MKACKCDDRSCDSCGPRLRAATSHVETLDPHEQRRARYRVMLRLAEAAGVRLRRAVGGHLAHACEPTDRGALCGFEPSNGQGSSMAGTDRGSWSDARPDPVVAFPCRRCMPILQSRGAT